MEKNNNKDLKLKSFMITKGNDFKIKYLAGMYNCSEGLIINKIIEKVKI